jgi:hypothetical protein
MEYGVGGRTEWMREGRFPATCHLGLPPAPGMHLWFPFESHRATRTARGAVPTSYSVMIMTYSAQ